jgi:hypothetical protein
LTRAALLVLLLIVATASDCPVDPSAPQEAPPKPVAGSWTGELYGERFELLLTESGTPDRFFNVTSVGGSGWMIYGSPADSVAVMLAGINSGGPYFGVSLDIQPPTGIGRRYGYYFGTLQTDGTLLGDLTRFPAVEPSPSPWTGRWPEGVDAATLRLTRR